MVLLKIQGGSLALRNYRLFDLSLEFLSTKRPVMSQGHCVCMSNGMSANSRANLNELVG